MEFCSSGTSSELIKSKQLLSTSLFRRVSYEVIASLSYMHSYGIAHGDIRLANNYFDNIGRTKLVCLVLSKN